MNNYKSGDELFDDLVNLPADEWNKSVAESLGLTPDQLRDSIITREIDITKKSIKMKINKSKVKKMGKLQVDNDKLHSDSRDDDDSADYRGTVLEKYTITLSDDDKIGRAHV